MIVIDLLEQSQQGPKTIHQLIEDSMATYPDIKVDSTWRDYAKGKMEDHITSKRKRAAGRAGLPSPQQNVIRMCRKQIVGRVRFKRFVVDDEAVQEFLDEYAAKNSMVRKTVSIADRALTDGNTAVSQVWRGGEGGMAIVRQEFWDGANTPGIFVAVDDTGDPVWAVSDYVDNEMVEHRVIYLPNKIMRFFKGDGEDGWKDNGEDEWVASDGKPIGVPVAHFPNADLDYGPYGNSTVKEVIGIQDDLNISLFNRLAVGAVTGQRILWGTGMKPPGEVGLGDILSVENDAAKFGSFDPSPMDGLIQETDDLRNIVSSAFPVPSYRLGGRDWPSGLALQRSDGPMITSVRLLRDVINPGLIYLAHKATTMANTFGGYSLNEDAIISVEWEPVDDLDPSTEAEITDLRADTLSKAESLSEVSLKKLGIFTNDEIEEILKEREENEELIAASALDDEDEDSGF